MFKNQNNYNLKKKLSQNISFKPRKCKKHGKIISFIGLESKIVTFTLFIQGERCHLN